MSYFFRVVFNRCFFTLSSLAFAGILSTQIQAEENQVGCTQEGQWAAMVKGFSSEYSNNQWSAAQILGPCDIDAYGDNSKSWSAKVADRGLQWIELSFNEATYSSGVIIRENFNPGFVRRIEVLLEDGKYETMWEGTAYQFVKGVINDSRFTWQLSGLLTVGVRITIDTMHVAGSFETIDAVQLLGPPVY